MESIILTAVSVSDQLSISCTNFFGLLKTNSHIFHVFCFLPVYKTQSHLFDLTLLCRDELPSWRSPTEQALVKRAIVARRDREKKIKKKLLKQFNNFNGTAQYELKFSDLFFLSTEVDFLRNNRAQQDRLMIVLDS